MPLLFIFDMDDVLVDYDWRVRMASLTATTGLSLAELRRRWWTDEGEWGAEAGRFDGADHYLAAFNDAIGFDVPEQEWVRIRGAAMKARPAMLAAAARAAELGTITLLTNNNPMTGRHLGTLAPEVAELFGEHAFTSSHYGARKPDPLVFERVLASYQVDAENAFFADDQLDNILGARSIGITAHHVLGDHPEALVEAIETFAAARAS